MNQATTFSPDKTKRILLYSPNWVGDAVMATATLSQLRRCYPEAQIHVFCIPWVKPVWEGNPNLNGIIVYDPSQARFRLPQQLKRELSGKFDLAILLPNSLRAAWLMFQCGIPLRIGYNRDMRGVLLTHRVNDSGQLCHQAEYYLNILKHMGWPTQPPKLCWTVTPQERDWAEQYLAGHPNWLAVQPGAAKPQKRWHSERFAELIRQLTRQYQFRALLLGSTGEMELLQDIQHKAGLDACHIPQGLNLRQVAALTHRCRLFVGNDSGLMHTAAAVGTPVVGIFGPGTPITTAPCMEKDKYRVVLREMPCRPCRQHFFRECKPSESGKPPCLEAVTVEDVLRVVEELLCAT